MTTATGHLTPLLRARQARLRCAEKARHAELRAATGTGGQLTSDWAELAADYRRSADEWAKEVARLEAELGCTRRQCANPDCDKRAADGDTFCPEHD